MSFINTLSRTLVLGITTLVLIACDNNETSTLQKEVLRPVKTLIVEAPNKGEIHEFPGVIDAAQKADLSFRVSGILEKLTFNEGDKVKKGQLLAQLDQTDFKIVLKSTLADFAKAEADFGRAQRLIKSNTISRSDFDKLKAQYSEAEARLASSKQDLKYTELRAPFDGNIAKRYTDNFEEVSAKQSILALQDISSLLVKIDVPENILISVTRDKYQKNIYAVFSALGDTQFPLTFKEISIRADEKSQTFAVTFTMPAAKDKHILPGMSVKVIVRGTVLDDIGVIFLPSPTVLEDRNGRYVYLAIPQDKETATIKRREVTTGRLTAQGIEVLKGLAVGEHVVTAGMSKMVDGMLVRLMSEPAQ